jgi:hypothetical protein
MIIFNSNRVFSGGRRGVIQNASFRCALNTVSDSHGSRVVVSSFSGDWEDKNRVPVAEALLDKKLSRDQARQIHDEFLEQMDRCGANGIDLGAAIEEVFGDGYLRGMVTQYENNAAVLLEGQR